MSSRYNCNSYQEFLPHHRITPWCNVFPALYYTPVKHDIPLEPYKDPVTGATIFRPRKRDERINSNSNGKPISSHCNTKGCALRGQPHEECKKKDAAQPFYCSKCGRRCSCPGMSFPLSILFCRNLQIELRNSRNPVIY